MAKVSSPFVRSAYNYDVSSVSDETALCCDDPSLAQQNFAEECDINRIVETFTRTGQIEPTPLPPQFGDFTGIRDFHTALNSVLAAQEAFLELAPAVRSRFNNDPQNLINFLEDPANRDEAVELGLVPADLSPAAARSSPIAKRSDAAGGKSKVSQKPSVEPLEGSEEGD